MNEFRKAISAVAEHRLVLAEHDRTILHVTGADALDLLHRLSTNDLLNGPDYRAVSTVFCSEKGRVVEAADVVIGGPGIDALAGGRQHANQAGQDMSRGGLFMTCSRAGSQSLLQWIEKYTIAEDIHLSNVTDLLATYCILGPQAIQSIGDVSPQDGAFWTGRFGVLPCIRILSARGSHARALSTILEEGVPFIESAGVFEFLRVLHSVPLYGHEIVEAYNPYEIGLTDAISFTKGCYIGQEVIARLDTYKRVQRQLRMLWSDSSDPVQPGTPVIVAGEQAGIVTSSTSGLGRTIALAVIRNEAIVPYEVFRINTFPYVLNDVLPLPYSLIFRQDAS